ncbi:MAG: dihydrofolate reductase [Ruminococcus sp.]|nr:dihydrofolate reductase [Ruminococcus sp.]
MTNIISAIAKNGVIGSGGKIPWDLPEDRKYFKKITSGNVIIMGRRTFQEIGFPLPDRYNIIVSSTENFRSENMVTVPDFASALETGRMYAERNNIPEIFLCGGAEIYRQGLAVADRIYLTEIDSCYSGDVFFPVFSEKIFILTSRTDTAGMSFCIYDRTGKEL